MYSGRHDSPRYSADGLPGPVPAPGIPEPSSSQPYPPQASGVVLPARTASQPYVPLYVPPAVPVHGVPTGHWSTGLCHCCDDPANCVITCFCPCITFGQIAQIVNRGTRTCATSGAVYGLLALTGFACFYSCFYRSKLRGQYDLPEAPCVDCLVHFFCEACALCQEYRELKSRGYDMGIGWEANMNRQQRGITVAPTVAPGMTR